MAATTPRAGPRRHHHAAVTPAHPVPNRPDHAAERAALRRIWAEQLAWAEARGGDAEGLEYLRTHLAMDLTLDRHLRVLDRLVPHVRGRVLEWGCRHALDACVYRLRLGESVELHGCDICDGEAYRPFHAFSGIDYRRLDHPWRLPYGDESFNVATSNGVLEHVPDEERSLGELARVLRPGGLLLVTCLPNRHSYTEAIQRRRGVTSHDRLYTLGSAGDLLGRHGFVVFEARRFLMVPTMLHGVPGRVRAAYQAAGPLMWLANGLLERAWPVNRLASNLMLLARKVA